MEAKKVRRKNISVDLQVKLKAINDYRNGVTTTDISKKLGVHKSTILLWVKKENVIKEWSDGCQNHIPESRKRLRKPVYDEVDKAMWLWYQERLRTGAPISGPLIKEQALKFAKLLDDDTEFNASQGWLARWKKRNGIISFTHDDNKPLDKEKEKDKDKDANGDSEMEVEEDSRFSFDEIVAKEKLTPDQIFTYGETSLAYREIPSALLSSKHKADVEQFKGLKEQVTMMACSNSSGRFKLPLVIVGKAAIPNSVKSLTYLPVKYKCKKKIWMNHNSFEEWFYEEFVPVVSKFLTKQKLPEKAILFMDSSMTYTQILRRGDIRVEFFPSQVANIMSPMNQEFFKSVKMLYRLRLLSFILDNFNTGLTVIESLSKITVQNVIFWATNAWIYTPVYKIVNAWKQLWPEIVAKMETPLGNIEDADQSIKLQAEDLINQICDLLKNYYNFREIDIQEVNEWVCFSSVSEDTFNEDIIQVVREENEKTKRDITQVDPSEYRLALKNNLDKLIEHCTGNKHYSALQFEALKSVRDSLKSEF
ncbi:jerky protein homolog-like [Cotesia glomerata]|uniref:jerky protein homolog-like n=1 Tax=Cotesia glomerata TaxID=32391 RepID=UPI001D00B971|nr:jerky protein homolog-like [Cotesia glomerata]